MGTWNYRVVAYHGGGHGLHEVFYDDEGNATARTRNPITFTSYPDDDEPPPDGRAVIIQTMARALRDARERPVFQEPAAWAESEEKPRDAD